MSVWVVGMGILVGGFVVGGVLIVWVGYVVACIGTGGVLGCIIIARSCRSGVRVVAFAPPVRH